MSMSTNATTFRLQTKAGAAAPVREVLHRRYRPDTAAGSEVRSFRFRMLCSQTRLRPRGILGNPGELRRNGLWLDGRHIPLSTIRRVEARLDRLVLTIEDGRRPTAVESLSVWPGPMPRSGGAVLANALKQAIDRAVSADRARSRRVSLRRVDQEPDFRACRCGGCGATVDLTGFEPTPRFYCASCDSLSVPSDVRFDAPTREAGRSAHHCDACGRYDALEGFASDVLEVSPAEGSIHWRSERSRLCRPCARQASWRAVGRNLPTLLGLPLALGRLVRLQARHAWSWFRPAAEVPAAGFCYNEAKARAERGDWAGCVQALDRVWADCSNYAPALPLAREALGALGRTEEARSLAIGWGQLRPLSRVVGR